MRLYLFLRADVAFDSFYAPQFDVFNSGGDKGFAVGEMLGVKRRVNAALDDNVAVERSVFVDSACIFQTRAEMEVLGELLQRCRRCDNFHHRRRYHLPLKII